MKKFKNIFITGILILCFYNFIIADKICVDYDFSNRKTYNITPLEFYFGIYTTKYDKRILNIVNKNDSVLVLKIKEKNNIIDYKYYTNSYNNVFNFLKIDYNPLLDNPFLNTIYVNFTIYSNTHTFFYTTHYKKDEVLLVWGLNIYKQDNKGQVKIYNCKFKKGYTIEELKNINFNTIFESKLIKSIERSNCKLKFNFLKNTYEMEDKDVFDDVIIEKSLYNAKSINSPFFHEFDDNNLFNKLMIK